MRLSCMYLKEKFNMYQDTENIKYVDCSHRMNQTLNWIYWAGKSNLKNLVSSTNSLKESYAKYWFFSPQILKDTKNFTYTLKSDLLAMH